CRNAICASGDGGTGSPDVTAETSVARTAAASVERTSQPGPSQRGGLTTPGAQRPATSGNAPCSPGRRVRGTLPSGAEQPPSDPRPHGAHPPCRGRAAALVVEPRRDIFPSRERGLDERSV